LLISISRVYEDIVDFLCAFWGCEFIKNDAPPANESEEQAALALVSMQALNEVNTSQRFYRLKLGYDVINWKIARIFRTVPMIGVRKTSLFLGGQH
jgi:hypothetical protein